MTKKQKIPVSSKKPTETEQYWKDYTAALVRWKMAYEIWYRTGTEALKKYNFAIKKTVGPEQFPEVLSQNWEKAWMESGLQQIKKFGDEWQHMLKASGLESINRFNEDWKKFWAQPGLDPSITYVEAFKQFSKTWQDMWKK